MARPKALQIVFKQNPYDVNAVKIAADAYPEWESGAPRGVPIDGKTPRELRGSAQMPANERDKR